MNRLPPSRPAAVACLLLIGALLAGLAAPTAARAAPEISIREFGRYVTERGGKEEPAARTASGSVTPVHKHKLVKRTNEIFGQLGRSFGVLIDLSGFPPGRADLIIRTLHPPLTNPKTGKTTTVSEYDWSITRRTAVYFGFTFDETWEIAEGVWTMQFVYRGRVLAEQKFKIVVPLN